MNILQKYLKPEEIEALEQNPGLLVDIEKHLKNPLYKDANFAWQRTQVQQIIKGAEKYPEPLNPFSWTPAQLIEHAMQENVDQAHYLSATLEQIKEMELWINKYKSDAEYWRKKYLEATGADEDDLADYKIKLKGE